MYCQPRLLVDHPLRRPKISLILIDWGVRESFHTLHYLNRQSVPRDEYELIWLEFYKREPAGLREAIGPTASGRPAVDRWIVAGYPDEVIYHKHRLYNLGIMAARGDICVICDSDAIYTPHFIERLIAAFEETPHGIIHLDQVRSGARRYYPFDYPDIEEMRLIESNWRGNTTTGLLNHLDRMHDANMGACLAARRNDLLLIGGADEHIDYLGYMCGPYEMTFRLSNYYGVPERWLQDEFLYHTWHPNTSGGNDDYHGPQDGRSMSLRTLHARASYRVSPFQRSPLMNRAWRYRRPPLAKVLDFLASRAEPGWLRPNMPAPPTRVYWGLRNKFGFNLFCHRGTWYALPLADGYFCPRRYQKGGYANVMETDNVWLLERMIEERVGFTPPKEPGRFKRMMRRLREEPLSSLPGRIWRKARRVASGLRKLPAT